MMETKIQPTGNWFVDKLNLYQAANSDNASLKKNFVIRTHEFELIIDDLRSKKNNDPLQHELILGRRGSGKSTLLKRLQIEIEEDQKLAKKYIPINLAEEQAGIYRLSDLWFETLQEIGIKENTKIELTEFSSFKESQQYTRYLYDEIHQILAKNKKKVVLLLDNLDRILENFNEDAQLFREILQNFNDIQIVGGSTRMDEHFWKYDKPFYEFFRRHRLEALTFEEIQELMGHWSDAMQITELKDYALRNRGKIEALRILTDGLPRTLQFFIQILLHDSNLYGFEYIKKVMDKATPLYQERLNNLTPAHRKIVLEMAFIWEAASTKQLVDKCRMEGKLISSYLKQLNNYGIVEIVPTSTKNHLYRLYERFFTMWLIVTQGNPDQKRKAKFLTIFLETWYDGNEMKGLASGHLDKLLEGNMTYDKAAVLTKAFSQSKYISLYLRDELIENTLKLVEEGQAIYELPETFKEIFKKITKLKDEGKYKEALDLVEEIENEEDGYKFFYKAFLFKELGNIVEAEKYYLLVIDIGKNIDAYNNLANLYLQTNQKKKEGLELIKRRNINSQSIISKQLELIIEIWNGLFENVDEKVDRIITESNFENLEDLIQNLLCLNQKNLLQTYFEHEKYGKELRERYTLYYYATLILCNRTNDNLELRIPPEVMPTVRAIVEQVKEKNLFYEV